MQCSRNSEALKEARRAHERFRSEATHVVLIEALSVNRLKDELERESSEYVKRYPNDFMGYGMWGEAAYMRGDLETAEKRLRRSINLYPRQGGAWATLAHVYFDKKRFEEAIDA